MRLNEVFHSSKTVTTQPSANADVAPPVSKPEVEETATADPAPVTKSKRRRAIYGFKDEDQDLLEYLEQYNPGLYSKLDNWD